MTEKDLTIQNLRRENEALRAAYHEIAEDLVAFGRVDYWLCDEIPTKLHLKYQPQNDGNYENKPCVECVKEYYFQKSAEGGKRWQLKPCESRNTCTVRANRNG